MLKYAIKSPLSGQLHKYNFPGAARHLLGGAESGVAQSPGWRSLRDGAVDVT